MAERKKIDLDLDAIKGRSKWVKLHGKAIEVPPITVDDLLEMQIIISDFEATQNKKLKAGATIEMLKAFQAQIAELIPGLKNVRCTLTELMAIVNLAFDTAVPQEQEELKKRGITPKDHQKKVTTRF